MSNERKNPIRNNEFFKYVSTKKYLKIFVPGFAFKHDNDFADKDKFVGREVQFRRLYMWLTSDSKSGSYLVTGYRGMGKSMLVKRVLDMISRERIAWLELVFYFSIIFAMFACVLSIGKVKFANSEWITWCFGVLSVLCILFLELCRQSFYFSFQQYWLKWRKKTNITKDELSKYIVKYKDGRNKAFNRIHISINLGQEILNERDVLSVIAQNVRNKYNQFVKTKQCRPFHHYIPLVLVCIASTYLAKLGLEQLCAFVKEIIGNDTENVSYKIFNVVTKAFDKHTHQWRYETVFVLVDTCLFFLLYHITKKIRLLIPYFSTPYRAINRLNNLCDRINASVNEENKTASKMNNSWLSISFFNRGRKKEFPIANVREIEQELQDIINSIASKYECPGFFMAQFIIVFDELDKVSGSEKTETLSNNTNTVNAPEFDTSIEGFTGTMGFEERKKEVLHLLANMKLFITTVKAKCVFISGHELFDASLADLSDREFAISSVFNGVLNIDSFLTPEREQNEVSSMTELYIATLLLPEDFLLDRMRENAEQNGIIKEELPSLRWYNDYLLKDMLESNKDKDEEWIKQREKEIQFVMEFLRHFAVYLAHISNGSPKKIATYFEKYIRTEYDTKGLYEWNDIVSVGYPIEKHNTEKCVLWFDINTQRFINFINYIASPLMKAITNEISHFGDKLLVTSSFILDQVYKYHGKGFSWRNLEQMPELLNANKNPELRDSMSTMMEFLLQTPIARISAGVNQYKFHKQISEEITFMSMTSEEASAIFNFTLNESMTVKRYNHKLLTHYLGLSKRAPKPNKYNHVLERLHENLGDIYYMDEDYYCAIHEYSNALNYLDNDNNKSEDIIAYLKCCLKIGMSYEYRRTYENAYMMYCRIINKLIHVRWIDENSLGLNYTWRWSNDWRLKQPLLVNNGALFTNSNTNDPTNQPETHEKDKLNEKYIKQFNTGVWEDIEKRADIKPEYSTGTDNIISALAYNYTPEKSDVVKGLTVFEDIRYIYLAIIAKLFVIEKMELGGVSFSSIEIAETEFLYLHSATNMKGKFMISADFFYKMAEIMYYKNGYIAPVQNVTSLVSALYFYGYNILGFIDDFCFSMAKKDDKNHSIGAVRIKEIINNFFYKKTFNECIERPNESIKQKIKSLITKEEHIVNDYLEYIPPFVWDQIEFKKDKITHCALRRDLFLKMGYKMPCNACHYSYRSLDILMEYLFVDENNEIKEKKNKVPKILRVLYLTSRKHIRHIRQSELTIFAKTVEQIGDIMLSCSSTRTAEFDEMSKAQHPFLEGFNWGQDYNLQDDITDNAVELLEFLSGNVKSETERKAKLDEYENVYLSRLDKSILYYWAASRFYEMASLYKEESYCMERIMKVLRNYLKVVGSSESRRDAAYSSVERLYDRNKFTLINNIFKQAAKHIGMEYEYQIMGEIHEYKWLLHCERMDDVDLTKIPEFSDLKPIFITAVDVKIRILDYLKRFNNSIIGKENCQMMYSNYITKIYARISNPLRHENTFKEEVLGYYMKAYVNKLILIDCLGDDVMAYERKRCNKFIPNNNVLDLHILFYQKLSEYLDNKKQDKGIGLLGKNDIKSKLNLIEFLIHDSFVCLSSILSILTPHNHITTFSNVFMAEVYDLLWEWSKYYELLYDLYLYRKYDDSFSKETLEAIVKIISRNNINNIELLSHQLKDCLEKICTINNENNDGGYEYTRFLMNIRHDVDDTTIHHLISNVAADMSTKYYKMAKDVNNEGAAYKNMITVMYVLDDDLHNDTCQSNLADERYLWHSGYIDGNRDIMIKMYENTSISNLVSFEKDTSEAINDHRKRIKNRLEDSIFINSEY